MTSSSNGYTSLPFNAILPLSTDSRRVVVSYKRKYVHKVLVNRLCLGYICHGRRMIYLSTIFPTIFSAS